MDEKEIFKLDWSNGKNGGSLQINFDEFFSVSNKRALTKFFKLVRDKSKNGECVDLINRLYVKKKSCDDILTPLAELRKQSEKLLSQHFGREEKIPLSPQEKEIAKRRDKYAYGIKFLTEGAAKK